MNFSHLKISLFLSFYILELQNLVEFILFSPPSTTQDTLASFSQRGFLERVKQWLLSLQTPGFPSFKVIFGGRLHVSWGDRGGVWGKASPISSPQFFGLSLHILFFRGVWWADDCRASLGTAQQRSPVDGLSSSPSSHCSYCWISGKYPRPLGKMQLISCYTIYFWFTNLCTELLLLNPNTHTHTHTHTYTHTCIIHTLRTEVECISLYPKCLTQTWHGLILNQVYVRVVFV